MSGHSDVRASASVYHPQASEMRITRGTPGEPNENALYLDVARGIYIGLGLPSADLAGEIAAMRKLAEMATEAAAELERRAVAS
jgi:hypothetical protein